MAAKATLALNSGLRFVLVFAGINYLGNHEQTKINALSEKQGVL
jgi:hypothetical protein